MTDSDSNLNVVEDRFLADIDRRLEDKYSTGNREWFQGFTLDDYIDMESQIKSENQSNNPELPKNNRNCPEAYQSLFNKKNNYEGAIIDLHNELEETKNTAWKEKKPLLEEVLEMSWIIRKLKKKLRKYKKSKKHKKHKKNRLTSSL